MKRILLAIACTLVLLPATAIAQMLTDAQAQVLMMKASQNTDPSKPALTQAEMMALNQYLMAKQQTAASAAGAAMPTQGMMPNAMPKGAMPQQAALPTAAPMPAATPTGDKKPGIIRIGLAMPKAQMGQGNQGPAVGEPLRQMLAQYLHGPNVEIVSLASLLPAQIAEEAKQANCDYVVMQSITQIQKKSGFGMLKGATMMSSVVPMAGMTRSAGGMMAAATAAQAAATAQQAATISNTVKSKSDVTLDYQLQLPGGAAPVLSNSLKAKADSDGQDVVTPLVEQEATAIMAQITKK